MMQLGDRLIVTGLVIRAEQLHEHRFGISMRFVQNEPNELAKEIEGEGFLRDVYQLELCELNVEALRYGTRLTRVLDDVAPWRP